MEKENVELSMAERLALWRQQRSTSQTTQTNANSTLFGPGIASKNIQLQKTTQTTKSNVLGNKLRVNNSQTSKDASAEKDSQNPSKRSLSQSDSSAQSQNNPPPPLNPVQKRSKVAFDLPPSQPPPSALHQTRHDPQPLQAPFTFTNLIPQPSTTTAVNQKDNNDKTNNIDESTKLLLQNLQHRCEILEQELSATTGEKLTLASLVAAKETHIQNLQREAECYQDQLRLQAQESVRVVAESVQEAVEAAARERESALATAAAASRESELRAVMALEAESMRVREVVDCQRARIAELTLRVVAAEAQAAESAMKLLSHETSGGDGRRELNRVEAIKEAMKLRVGRLIESFEVDVMDTKMESTDTSFEMQSNQYHLPAFMLDAAVQTTEDVNSQPVLKVDASIQCDLTSTQAPNIQTTGEISSQFMQLESEIITLLHQSELRASLLESRLSTLSESYKTLESTTIDMQHTLEVTSETYTTNTLLLRSHLASITCKVNQLVDKIPLSPSSSLAAATMPSATSNVDYNDIIQDDSSDTISNLQSQLSAMSQRLQDSTDQLLTLNNTLTETAAETSQLHTQIDNLKAEIRDCYQVIDYYEHANTSHTGKDTNTSDKEQDTRESEAALQQQISDLRLELELKQTALIELEDEKSVSAEHMRARVIELEMLRVEVAEAYEVIDDLQESSSGKARRGRRGHREDDVDARSIEEEEEEEREALEKEVKEYKERMEVLYRQVETLASKNRNLMDKLEKREKKVKEVQRALQTCQDEKKRLLAKRDQVSGPLEEMETQTELTTLTLQQAENAISNVKLLRLDNEILKCEMQKEKNEYVQKINKLTKEVQEREVLEANFNLMNSKTVGLIEQLMATNKSKEEEISLLRQQLESE